MGLRSQSSPGNGPKACCAARAMRQVRPPTEGLASTGSDGPHDVGVLRQSRLDLRHPCFVDAGEHGEHPDLGVVSDCIASKHAGVIDAMAPVDRGPPARVAGPAVGAANARSGPHCGFADRRPGVGQRRRSHRTTLRTWHAMARTRIPEPPAPRDSALPRPAHRVLRRCGLSLLLAAAARWLGTAKGAGRHRCEPVTAGCRGSTPTTSRRLGVTHLEAATQEMLRPGYRENGTSVLLLQGRTARRGRGHLSVLPAGARVATGTNADDLVAGFRPGIRAAADRGAVTPLADAGMSKQLIRDTAREWGLAIWGQAPSCLPSSRVAYGIQISPQRLARVEAAELALRRALADSGVSSVDVRVRDLGEQARIEVDAELAGRPAGAWQAAAVAAMAGCGFAGRGSARRASGRVR